MTDTGGDISIMRRKSRILQVVHETANGLHNAGATNKATMREFDALCFPPSVAYTPKQIMSVEHGHDRGLHDTC